MAKVQVGSIIKAYDFSGITSCYIIGQVTKVDGDYIVAAKIKEVFDNETKEIRGKTFRTPKQGLMMNDDRFERIVLVG